MPTTGPQSWKTASVTAALLLTVATGCATAEGDDNAPTPGEPPALDISRITQLEQSLPEGGEYHHNRRNTMTQEIIDTQQQSLDTLRVEPPECRRVGSNGEIVPLGTAIESVSISMPTSFVTLAAQELPVPRVPAPADAPDCSRFTFYGPQGDGIVVPTDGPVVPDATSVGVRTMTFSGDGLKADQYAYYTWLDETHVISAIVLPRVESAPGELYVNPDQGRELLVAAAALVRG